MRVRTGGRDRRLAQVPVTITVTDVNDNAPYFTRETYYATVMVDAKKGTHVTRVSKVYYYLTVCNIYYRTIGYHQYDVTSDLLVRVYGSEVTVSDI